MTPPDFFIGWSGRTGPALGRFLYLVAGVALLLVGAVALAVSGGMGDPGARWRDPIAEPLAEPIAATLVGRVHLRPLPMLERADTGGMVLLGGAGKRGPTLPPGLSDGAMIAAQGVLLGRGSVTMLTDAEITAQSTPETTPAPNPGAGLARLGRYRVQGEICDGKCWTGAMRPGSGLAHRACANLCFAGGLPPILVTRAPVAGESFLILADAGGGPLPPARYASRVGSPVTLSGTLERLGNAVIFRLDPD